MQMRGFTEEQELFRDSYRQFRQKQVLPYRQAWREAGIVPHEMFRKMGENGYLLAWADEEYGGLGIRDFRFQQIMLEEDAAFGEPGLLSHPAQPARSAYIEHFGSKEQCRRFLPKCISG
jgi:alkylation response protein AidB-like acyl-CoA dehydrogenase